MATKKNITEREIWKPVVGWEAFYEVSSIGRVRTLEHRVLRGPAGTTHTRIVKSRIRRAHPDRDGYPRLSLKGHGSARTMSVHILILRAFVGPPKRGQLARHLNGNPPCCRLSNLVWGTYQENMADRDAHGRTLRGTQHAHAKINEATVRSIRAARKTGQTYTDIAAGVGLDRTQVSRICRRVLWAHVT